MGNGWDIYVTNDRSECMGKRMFFGETWYSRTHLIRPPSESHWCGRIRGMVAREGFVYKQKVLSVTRNVVV